MKKLYTLLSFALLSFNANAQSVGIKNLEEDTNITYDFPANDASLDTYFTKRGILIPQYDLIELDNPKHPVDFTNDLANNKTVDGTMIFNYGTNHTRGFYIWTQDKWHLALYKGSEPQQLIISIPKGTNVLKSSSLLYNMKTAKNHITDSNVSSNTITLPAGKYSYKFAGDFVGIDKKDPKYFNFVDSYSILTSLKMQKVDGTPITENEDEYQYTTVLSGSDGFGNFTFFQGLFIFELTEPTTIQQVFKYSDGSSYTENIETKSDMTISITRLPL